MFKLIKVDFYDEFACLMSECPDNCCDEDWDIYIDDPTIEKYRQMHIQDLSEKITETIPHKLIKKNGRCPFITPEGLCSFHRDYGEEYLSNTCRSYPRFVSTYGDVYLETLGMSCPAVVKKVIGLNDLVSFPERMYYEDASEAGKTLERTEIEKLARRVIEQFNPANNGISAFLDILDGVSSAPENIPCISDLISKLKDVTKGTPSETYVRDLFGEGTEHAAGGPAVNDPDIQSVEGILYRQRQLFSCNLIRIWLFEHIMLESKGDHPDYPGVIVRGLLIWLLLLACLKQSVYEGSDISDGLLIDKTYRLMRVVDHGPAVLDELYDCVTEGGQNR